MLRRWTPKEDKSIKQQMKRGIAVTKISIPGRKSGDIRKRMYRIGLLVANIPKLNRDAARWAAIEAALRAGNKTRKQLEVETGMSYDILRGAIKRNRMKIHIADWVLESPKGHRKVPLFKLGAGEDAIESESSALDNRGDPEAAMIAEARDRLRQAEERGELIRRDPFVAALFGKYRPLTAGRFAG